MAISNVIYVALIIHPSLSSSLHDHFLTIVLNQRERLRDFHFLLSDSLLWSQKNTKRKQSEIKIK